MGNRYPKMSTAYLCLVITLSFLASALFIFYVAAVSSQMPSPRSAGEADLLFSNYNSTACSRDEDLRFGWNWFYLNTHYVLGLVFILFPIMYLLSLCSGEPALSFIPFVIISVLSVLLSMVGYFMLERSCKSYSDKCGKQCIYQAAEWNAPKINGDIEHTSRVSTAFTLLRALVPIMWAFAFAMIIFSCFAFDSAANSTAAPRVRRSDRSTERNARKKRNSDPEGSAADSLVEGDNADEVD
jgi:hypothetical protein